MAIDGPSRRLAAILFADVVGYSAKMEAEEELTLATVRKWRRQIVDPLVSTHHGRVVKGLGDGVLIEFVSAVSAVQCAIELQAERAAANVSGPPENGLWLRIGVNLGEVIGEDADIFGSGVNIAARLEALASPGGICVSGKVRDEVLGKLDFDAADMGELKLKNIAQPVRVFQISPAAGAPAAASIIDRQQTKPSLAVLPFETASREHEWFSDGIAEDVTTVLAKSRRLKVVSKNYSFAFKGKGIRGDEVARQLHVKYLLEGSVRMAGARVRVSTRLLEGATGELVWGERFDRDLADVFEIQDEITAAVVRHLELELAPDERDAMQRARTLNFEAYEYELRGRQFAHELTKSYLVLARRMFSKAVELDSGYARAHVGMVICDCYLRDWHGMDIQADTILLNAERALALDPNLPEAHAARGFALFCNERYEAAANSFDNALTLDRDCYDANFFFASSMLRFLNDRDRMLVLFKLTSRLRPDDYVSPMMISGVVPNGDPAKLEWAKVCVERAEAAAKLHPENASPLHRGAVALAHLKQSEKAKKWLGQALAIDPDDFILLCNAACVHCLLGEADEALDYLEKAVARSVPQNTIDMLRTDPDYDGIREHPRFAQILRSRS